MSNKYTDGLDQRYIQAFQGKDDKGNVKGSFGSADRGRYDAYAKATEGLDKDLAFKSLGGMGWGENDQERYDTALAERNKSQADAKARAQAHQKSSNNNVDSSTNKPAKAPNKGMPSNAVVDGSQKQDITQDNDINTNINGNQNTVINNQDNSIRQYGGNSKVFNYQGRGNSGVDTPVSAATMSGFYDTDDSPAATAKFFDLHNTLFQDAQKKFSGKGNEIASSYRNFDARGYDAGKLDSRIENSKLRSYDRATLAKNDLFGDQERYRGHRPEYKFGKGPDPIERE